MKRCFAVAFSCVVFAITSLSQNEAPKESQRQSIQGKVVEAKSGQPIRKVNVEIFGGAAESVGRYSATTSTDGTFTIEDLRPGRYTVILERTGFVPVAASRTQTTLALQPGQNLAGLVFKLQPAGVIYGKIVDADGDPMASVSVTAAAAKDVGRAPDRFRQNAGATNDRGEYRIVDLRPGKYLISATAFQRVPADVEAKDKSKERMVYASTYYPGTLDKSRAIQVEVRGGEEVAANFSVLMTHTYRVGGTVTGVPSAAMVRLMLEPKHDGADMRDPAELKEGNRFEFESVSPGTYVAMLLVVKGITGGQKPDMQMLRLTPSIEVDKGDVEGVQLQAAAGGQVHGRFRLDTEGKFDWTQLYVSLLAIEEDATEGSSGTFRLATANSQESTNPVVNSDGTFELKNVPAGNYQLLVGAHSDGLRDYYTKSVLFGGRDLADSGFAVNGDVYLDVVVSAKGATIEGNVVDTKAQPVPYCVVAVVPDSEHRERPDSYQQQSTDEHGHFSARGLNPGSYVVLAFEELQEDTREPQFLKTYGAKGEKVELTEGARKSVIAKVIPVESDAP